MAQMQVTVGSTIRVDNPSTELKAWCKKNLVLPNPEYAKKVRMGLWLGNTPSDLCLYEKHGQSLVLPFGTLREVLSFSQNAAKNATFSEAEEIDYCCSVPLYEYQKAAVNAMVSAKYGILQSPAGSGKTQMGIALMGELGRRTLWVTHTVDLLNQSKQRAERYINPDLIGTITEGKVNIGAGVTFATVQTMCRLDLDRYRDEWDVIIVDECHRCAGTPTAMTQFYKVLNSLAARHKYGLSATVHRSDGLIKATYALLGQVAYNVPKEAVADRVMPVSIKPCFTGTKISRICLNTDGTLNYAKLISYLCEDEARNERIAEVLKDNSGYSSLILSDRLQHLQELMKRLPAKIRLEAVAISGKTKKADREQALDDMRQGRKRYLFATYSLCKEGLDIPCLERLYLTTPQKDYAVITQSIGRIARVCEGKRPPVCFDFVDDIGYLVKAYKKRCTTYRKNGCDILQN